MCSYSTINGDYACQNQFLLDRRCSSSSGTSPASSPPTTARFTHDRRGARGTDQEQPFNTLFGTPLETDASERNDPAVGAEHDGAADPHRDVPLQPVRRSRRRHADATVTTPAHQAVGTDVADDGTVLLRTRRTRCRCRRPTAARGGDRTRRIGVRRSTAAAAARTWSRRATVTPLAGTAEPPPAPARTSATRRACRPISQLAAIPSSDSRPGVPAGGARLRRQLHGDPDRPGDGHVRAGDHEPVRLLLAASTCRSNGNAADRQSEHAAGQHLLGGGEPDRRPAVHAADHGGGEASRLTWATPSDLAPDLTAAAQAAKSAKTAVVVVSDDTESEATDRPSLNLPSAQDELISDGRRGQPAHGRRGRRRRAGRDAVARIRSPRWSTPGIRASRSGTSLADVLFGKVDPSGHLPVTFPTSLSQVPASTPGAVPGHRRAGPVLRGARRRLPLVRRQRRDAAVPVRLRAVLHEVRVQRSARAVRRSNGVDDVHVSATVTNVGSCAAPTWPSSTSAIRRSQASRRVSWSGFQRVSARPRPVDAGPVHDHPAGHLVVGRQRRRLDADPGPVPRLRRRLVGAGEPAAARRVRVTATPGARQVIVDAPSTMTPGPALSVTVTPVLRR